MSDGRTTMKPDPGQAGEARSRILGAIRDRGVVMRPRWHFLLRGVLAALGLAIVFLAVLYLASFVVYLLRYTGAWFVPSFGARGWFVLLLSLPWYLVVLIALFIVVLEVLVRRYAFAYRRPLLQTAALLLAVVVFGGVVVGVTPLHGRLSRLASAHAVPVFEPMYRDFEGWHRDDVHRGVVQQLTAKGFIFDEYDGDVLEVDILPKTKIADGVLAQGDTVVVFGAEDDGRIVADGVRRVSPADVD